MTEPTTEDRTRSGEFAHRHLGPAPSDLPDMLDAVGVASMEQLINRAVPEVIRIEQNHSLPGPLTETEALDQLRLLADQNQVFTSLIGMGYYGTILPAVIRRNLLENPGWYTAYTPYQPEISQGRLEALLNFQTMVSDLTGMDIANASLLDESTAAAEAMAMLKRINRGPGGGGGDAGGGGGEAGMVFVVDAATHPQTIDVVNTRARPLGLEVVVTDPQGDLPEGTFGVLLQYPGTTGAVGDHTELIARLHDAGTLVAVATDLLALTLLTPPGEMGADVVVGSSQRFGVPMMFGGPHAAFMATRDEHKRELPGRMVGVSKDAEGRMALRLVLQTREQHIRREKATSNICTAQVLLANIAGMYGVYHGPEGLTEIATRVHRLTSALAAALTEGGLIVDNDTWFDTLAVKVPAPAAVIAAAAERRINLRRIDATTVGVSLDETVTPETVEALFAVFGVFGEVERDAPSGIPADLARRSEFMTHPVFHSYRSETEMMRYLRRLQDADIALDRSMIPLGSCTMKLNAAAELIPVTWPEFSDLHPFVPLDQAQGYLRLIADLEAWLADITGYDAVSLQPNSGAQGEFAGLLAIRAYQASRGEGQRDVCLIPASAHGTNPASATMAGMRVVVVKTDGDGNIDVEDLRSKATEHADELAAIMVTYPSTHGVFEATIVEVCDIVHDAGGQVYLDGANLNAMVGIAEPGSFGSDVSHLNLHKTFAIPHGGGGPGVGPIGVREHLAEFLPSHPLYPDLPGDGDGIGAIASAPWGSAGVLSISWAYIAMMGETGLRMATEIAILNANYVAARLAPHYPVLYTGANGLVAHECIIDIRRIQHDTDVTNEDIAKRLIDYGFHAPTMSFPVAGTLMIEPTESESKAELDRFCDAMIAIKGEIDAIAAGEVTHADSVLANAPHPAENVVADDWARSYSREQAAYPVPGLRRDKYWVPVSRIDNAFGDRHIVCSCPPIEAYEQGIGSNDG
ncbi:MAG: aminomethyl-transferring glycine dehydrogenase [Acidobacteria bacterium]|nr:aminomethyl-transferring glycine dehydrogenase [Acidobacteriota bacterium]